MKTNLTTNIFTQAATQAGVAATLIVSLLTIGFFAVEPQIGHSAENIEFEIRQTIDDDTSFSVDPSDVTMTSSGISGLTGGTATGTTRFVVRSTSAGGYSVTIDFADNAGDHAMMGDEDGGDEIRDYAAGAGTPTFNMTASTAAQFAYSVNSSSSLDNAVAFQFSGSTCGGGGSTAHGKCWKMPSNGTPVEVVNRASAATAGATSTLIFKVMVPSGAVPTPTAQTYTATATLSVVAQ